MKRRLFLYCTVCFFVLVLATIVYVVKPDENYFIPQHSVIEWKQENNKCLLCHGTRHYKMVKPSNHNVALYKKMPKEYIVDTNLYYISSHWDFKCVDCHAKEYDSVPHNADLRFKKLSSCVDCHNGKEAKDSIWRKFRFKTIENEYMKSVHAVKKHERFNCYSCHDPHTTQMCLRNDTMPMQQVIEISNGMCVKCHATDKPKFKEAHESLPHMEIHVQKNRCIDCHSLINDSILVAHNVPDRKKATKKCVECHSTDSKLIRNFWSKRRFGIYKNKANTGYCKRKVHDPQVIGYYNNKLLSYSIIGICGFFLLFVLTYVIWTFWVKPS